MPSTTAWPTQRLQIISSHLRTSQPPIMATPSQKDPITCHVLDITTGRPATGIKATLVSLRPDWDWEAEFYAMTDADGRILNWKTVFPNGDNKAGGEEIKRMITKDSSDADTNLPVGVAKRWKLTFETGAYYGEDKTFFPVVDLTFLVKAGSEHYHVPLLLGPYSFTTYRGS